MNRRLCCGLLAAVLVWAPLAPAQGVQAMPAETGPAIPTGPAASVMLGANICIPNGDADCDETDAGFGMSLSALWRFIPWLAGQFDFFYGMYDTPSGTDMDSLGILFGPRGFIPIGPVDISAGVGVGWGKYTVSGGGEEFTLSGFTMGFLLGVEYRIIPWVAAGAAFRFHLPLFDEACQGSVCADIPDDADIAQEMMVGAHATFYFIP